jgi:peptidoglycan/LPS O-acetylase OafA/YrhL
MQTHTLAPVSAPARPRLTGWAAYLGAAALALGAGWSTLAAKGVTVSAAPRFRPSLPQDQALRIHYRWLASTLVQERLYTVLVIAGFAGLAVVAALARQVLGRDRLFSTAGAVAIVAGAAIWVTGGLVELGGHRAVGLLATHTNPIQVTNSISFTVDTISDTFYLAAFTFIAAGMLAYAWLALRQDRRAWAGLTLLAGLASAVTAWSFAAGNGDVTDLMLLIAGVIVAPGWIAWTGRLVTAQASPA